MTEEKCVLNCPSCGRVEGYVVSVRSGDEDDSMPESDMVIEQRVVQTPTGPSTRLRCPRCGRWVTGDRGRPA